MAVLQYVGARYVPKLFNDGQGGMEWQADTYYEPLTIVTYNNASYISRQPVPATIGNPVQNPGSWASTGSYNAYIEGLREQISLVSGRKMDKAANRRFLFISDSYGTDGQSWPEYTAAYMKATKFEKRAAGGASFYQGDFLSLLQRYDGNKNAITDIVVGGGYNDAQSWQNPGLIDSAIRSFAEYARAQYPNAALWLGFIGNGNDAASNITYPMRAIAMSHYHSAGRDNGFNIVSSEYALSYIYQLKDNVHPNIDGQKSIARVFANALSYCTGSFKAAPYSRPLTAPDGTELVKGAKLSIRPQLDTIFLGIPSYSVRLGGNITSGHVYTIADIEDFYVNSDYVFFSPMTFIGYDSTYSQTLMCRITLSANHISFSLFAAAKAELVAGSNTSISLITQSISIPALICN